MQKYYNKKRKLNKLKANLLLLMLVCFAGAATAQTNVYMHSGTQSFTQGVTSFNFYDSGGPSSVNGSYYWEKWYQHNENATIVFKNGTSPIQVTFGKFHAWGDSADGNSVVDLGEFSLRINNDHLYVYDGENADDSKLICDLTGTLTESFTISANGPITFKFVSDGQYRDEGWAATVTSPSTYTVQQPIITKETCSDYVILYNTAYGATVYYSTDNNDPDPFDPLSDATVYTAPFAIDLDAATASVLVRAIAVANGTNSAVASHTFTHGDQRPTPGEPQILIDGNTVTFVPDAVPAGLNETYNIRYTTDGSNPSATNGTLLTRSTGFSIEWHTPNTTFKAVTVAVTCSSKVSEVTTEQFGNVTVPTPTITFDGDGKAHIVCSLDGATIYYTTDGTQPTTSSPHGTTPVTTDALAIGTTVYAYAVFDAEGYDDSSVGSAIYVPESGSGTYGGVVFLDDREDHTWSYYSDGDQPIHSLKPADVKITYKGFGENTMTSTSTANMPATSAFDTDVEEDQVAVNVGEAGNQFIYLKTLENANEAGTGNYPYTMIANPFQKRPVYDPNSGGGSSFSDVTDFESGTNGWTMTGTGTANRWRRGTAASNGGSYGMYISNGSNNNTYGLNNYGNTATWSYAYKTLTLNAGTYTISYDWRCNGESANYSSTIYDYMRVCLAPSTASFSQGTEITNLNYSSVPNGWQALDGGALYGSTSWSTKSSQFTISSSGTYQVVFVWRNDGSTQNQPPAAIDNISITEGGSTSSDYRGFYAWRVKSLGGGLTITGKNVGDIIYPDETIEFVTVNAEGNEVEFEALWAKAWVNSTSSSQRATNSGNYKNAYERNFKVVTSLTTYDYPVTISSIYPDGSGTVSSVSRTSNYSCSNDVKLENMTLNMASNYLSANGYSLHIGRGVANGNNNVATSVRGNTTSNFTLRVESGRYTNIYGFHTTTSSSAFTANIIFGSDYDRATNTNTKLTVTGAAEVGYNGAYLSSSSTKVNVTVLSGTFGSTGANTELYMGFENAQTAAQAKRTLEVYGGNFQGGIAGGIEGGNIAAATEVLKMRIKGGTVGQYLYGSGQYAASYGTRKTIITGGTFTGWIAGGCYGTDQNTSGGVTNGNAYMYFGGDAKQTSTSGLFGGGYGSNATGDNKYTVQKSFVVVADDATLAGSAYGGGNNGYATSDSEVWVLGGGEDKLTVSGSVYGGANMSRSGATTKVTMKNGKVNGSVYGGAQGATATSDIVYVTGMSTVSITGGQVENNVFGGGYGSRTVMRGGTTVTVSGGSIAGNVYGGGEQGTVGRSGNNQSANTSVTISGGTVNDVYGAGKGTAGTAGSANIIGSTTVAVSGGTVNGSVYGGGQNGTVAYTAAGSNNTNYNSTVGVSGGEVKGNVYGGGKMGISQVATFVNISNGTIRGHVFGGAEGEQKKVFVTGMRTVNMTGGHVYGNVYGGSQNANDGNSTTLTDGSFSTSTETATMCVTNISGGVIDENVYAAGYFGNCFGSVYVFIGKDAIQNAPYKQPTTGIDYKVATLSIASTVWAGGDWGTFSGTFGSGTISGNSNVYVDGNGYETTTQQANNAQYMNIGGSILACGTSCYAGKAERTVIIRNYGTAQGAQPTEASRTLFSIQFAKVLIFDNSNINFTGQGRANQLNQTEKYSLYEIYNDSKQTNVDTDVDGVRIVNGSGLFLNAPVTQIANFRSMSCTNTFASTTPTLTGYTAITPETLSGCNNQVRVNNGNYIEIKWGSNYGALIGYAHMMSSNNDEDATCAYARPRWCTGAAFDQNSGTDNPNDGGWISYTASENTVALDGTAGNVQMAYENHTVAKNGEQYFRIWRVGGEEHYREGIFNAHASGTDVWKTVDVVVTLPAFRDPANYYCFETNGDATTIDYGADVLMWNAARESNNGAITNDWMYYKTSNPQQQMTEQAQTAVDATLTEMKKNANVNFGLVILPDTGMGGSDYIICYEADNNLADANTKFTKADNTKEPQIRFRLTYYDKLSSNMTWDPSTIVLVQKDVTGKVVDRVTISLAVSTTSTIEQEFTTQLYAIMQGKGSTSETFNAKVVLPSFAANLYTTGTPANFTLNSVDFEPANGGVLIARGGTYDWNHYAVGYAAGYNYDNSDGWNGEGNYSERDSYPLTQNNPTATLVGKTGGRTEFAIDFTLHYDGSQTATTQQLIGTLTFNITFDNYKNAQGQLVNNQPLTINVEVYRRGQGTKFYIDGINGSNANDARHPDKAVKQLSTIFNRCGYMAGDEIYIVNQVNADKQLDWNGLPYNNVTIYRYNGGHELSAADASIEGNPNNTAYLGNLLNVTNHMTMTGITLDGYYNNGETGTDENGGPHTVTATASIVTVAQGGTLELSLGTVLQNNNSSSVNGAAVNVANGGKLMMNQDATIKDNVTTGDGGGIYMAGTMVASDAIQIVNNKKGDAQNNVFLTAADKVITIGTASASDAYGELSADAKIGVTKGLSADIDGTYTRVVNVDQDVEWLETPFNSNPNSIIYHDGQKYQLVKYSDPKYLYWVGTWVTLQDHVPTAEEGGWPYTSSTTTFDINTEYQFAWIISLVNGENNQTPDNFSGKTINILADIDMDESIWVPIGTDAHPFKGTLKGNGHLIENMHSSLVQDYMGMLGYAEGAIVQDVMAAVNFDANSANMGAVAGVMKTTTISNVEAAGTITGGSNTVNMGGIVGDVQSGTIHSSFAVCDLTGATETVMGGLVGTNGGDLYNSFANTTMTGATQMGGLVGENKANCHVENCYVNLGQMEIPAFAYTNKGAITYCYASKAGQYVSADVTDNVAPTKSGIFAAVKDRKHLDYMYRDNIVTAEGNTYANHNGIEYTEGKHAPLVWNGLLSVLNQWVDKTEVEGDFSSWYRPTTNTINGDLPILAFPKDNCLGNYAEEDGKFLRYSAYNLTAGTSFNNGLDGLFTHYSGKAANIFLYNNATNVENGSGNAMLFINEDAVLLQSGSDAINATVGVTFDNSDHGQNAYDYYGNQLKYDWHFMSTPLNNAPMGITYSAATGNGGDVNITAMENNYFPNNLPMTTPSTGVKWDLYTYFEPEYHWINLKRSGDNHYHTDGGAQINYVSGQNGLGAKQNETIFVPGKGYMMAISQDSYMSNSGVLNNGDVTITLTNGEPQSLQYNKGWNLVGNPYQAYLDLKAVRTGADASYYIYDAESGDYVPYAVGASQNTVTPSRYIHPHQGFFMYSANDNNQFSFTQSMATTEKEDGSYFRGDEQINYPLVNLFARSQAGNNDLTIIELNRPEIGGATKMSFMTNANFELSAYLDGQDYGLLFTPEGTEKVPVHFTTQEDGTYTLTWDTQNGNFTSLLLVDNMTGTITDMLRSDHYTFDAKTSDYASRFYLTYACTGVEEVNEGDGSFAFFDGSEWVVNGKGQLDIIDVTGRVLFSKRIANEQNRVNLNNVAPGVYMMRISDGKDTMVQKIVVR